jgi:hypothetical protein
MNIEDRIFWTASGGRDTTIPDPLGLDALRERISDKLVPDLTGRTQRPEDAFWCVVLLRWSYALRIEDRVQQFLSWERHLKLLWAHAGPDKSVASPRTFAGIDRARLQCKDDGAPNRRFTPLLKNQRAQGMLGAYSRMMIRLELIDKGLELTNLGDSWTEGAGQAPELSEGSWRSWRAGFAKTFSAFPPFRNRLRDRLRLRLGRLHRGLESVGWNEDAQWLRAANRMGPDRRWALLADRFCVWADRLRQCFDDLVEDPKRQDIRFPGPLSYPSALATELPWQHWQFVSRYGGLADASSKKALLAEWHRVELKSRGYRTADLWMVAGERGIESRPFNSSSRNTEGSDCRWSNAVRMMRPR